MKPQSKLSHEQQHETTPAAHEVRPQAGQEFANADEMLRADAGQTTVPPQIAQRLKHSLSHTPATERRSWWKNLFGP